MPRLEFIISRNGKVGSDRWSYSVRTEASEFGDIQMPNFRGYNSSAWGFTAVARKVDNHYVLLDQSPHYVGGSQDVCGVEELDQVQKTDERLRRSVHTFAERILNNCKNRGKSSVGDVFLPDKTEFGIKIDYNLPEAQIA